VILSCANDSMGFCGDCVAAKSNVTGVDWSGLEWTGLDWSGHFFVKIPLDGFLL
jgi:hypothetical protein